MKHPHRYNIPKCFNMEKILYEHELSPFNIRCDSMPGSMVVLFAFGFWCLSVCIMGIVMNYAVAYGLNLNVVFVISPFIVAFVYDLMCAMPSRAVDLTRVAVHAAEDRDRLSRTSGRMIWFHYFFLRNHPLLSKRRFMIRWLVFTGCVIVPVWLVNNEQFSMIMGGVVCLFMSGKLVMDVETD